MGAGASVDSLPDPVNLEAAREVCGDHKYISKIFACLGDEEGNVNKATFLEYVKLSDKVEEFCNEFQSVAGADVDISEATIPKSKFVGIIKSLGHDMTKDDQKECSEDVSFKDFVVLTFHKTRIKSLSNDVCASFSVFDVNGDGFITVQEMKDAMQLLGEPISLEEAAAMIGDADVNSDGKIDIQEYGQKLTRDELPEELDVAAFLTYLGPTGSKEMFHVLKDSDTGKVKKQRLLNYERILAKVHNFRREFQNAITASGKDFITTDQAMLLINSWGYNVAVSQLGEPGKPVEIKNFLNVLLEQAEPDQEQLDAVETFKTFDEDGDGYVTAAELRKGLSLMGDNITEEEANEMVKEADADGDGRLNYIEYKEKLGFTSDGSSKKHQ